MRKIILLLTVLISPVLLARVPITFKHPIEIDTNNSFLNSEYNSSKVFGIINVKNWYGAVGFATDSNWKGINLTTSDYLRFSLQVDEKVPLGISLFNAFGEMSKRYIIYPKGTTSSRLFKVPLDFFDIDLSSVTIVILSISNKTNPSVMFLLEDLEAI